MLKGWDNLDKSIHLYWNFNFRSESKAEEILKFLDTSFYYYDVPFEFDHDEKMDQIFNSELVRQPGNY